MEVDFDFKKLADSVAPVFDKERGRRMEYMRKARLMDQRELGILLGVTQQMISKLERGVTPVSRVPITLSQLYEVFGCTTHHILFGSGKFNYEEINRLYWREKDRRKGNRTANRDTYANRRKLRRRLSG